MPAPAPHRWTDELIEVELGVSARANGALAHARSFAPPGATGLQAVVYRGRGSRWWATRLGLATSEPSGSHHRARELTGHGEQRGHGAARAGQRADVADRGARPRRAHLPAGRGSRPGT